MTIIEPAAQPATEAHATSISVTSRITTLRTSDYIPFAHACLDAGVWVERSGRITLNGRPGSRDIFDVSLLRQGAYRSAVAEAVADRGSRAFVLESANDSAALSPQLTSRIADLLAPGSTVTRLSTVVAAVALTDDATFTTPYAGPVPGERYVPIDIPRAYAGFGSALAIALLGALRRRPRHYSIARRNACRA